MDKPTNEARRTAQTPVDMGNEQVREMKAAQEREQGDQKEEKKEIKATDKPKDLYVGMRIPYRINESYDDDGSPALIRPGDTCVVGSSDANIVKIVPDRAGVLVAADSIASGYLEGVNPGKATITIGPIMRTDGKQASGDPKTIEIEVKPGRGPASSIQVKFLDPIHA
jgi:hypothetical protein